MKLVKKGMWLINIGMEIVYILIFWEDELEIYF